MRKDLKAGIVDSKGKMVRFKVVSLRAKEIKLGMKGNETQGSDFQRQSQRVVGAL